MVYTRAEDRINWINYVLVFLFGVDIFAFLVFGCFHTNRNYVLVYLFMGICGWSVCFIISVGTVLWFICLCVKGISLQFIGHRCCIIDGDAL